MADPDSLAPRFKALAYPTRLRLLSKLKRPRPVTGLDLTTTEDGRERTMTREGVRHHVLKLHEAGLVTAVNRTEKGRNQKFYQLRPQGIFSLSESLIKVVSDGDETPTPQSGARNPEASAGTASLVIVHGIGRGHRFLLTPSKGGSRGWIIGSSPKCDIMLSFDEDVDDQHAEIVRSGDEFALLDLRTSGPTTVNWSPLDRGDRAKLQAGDVVGVGSTLLVFQGRRS